MTSVFEYKEVVGISTESIEAAIKQALDAVSATHNVAWFEVLSFRGRMVDSDTNEYQVTVKVGCKSK
jgi:flavin-binding protein dodecin